MNINIDEILEATGGKLISGKTDIVFSGVSIDSRTIKENELFIAIKGQRFDGHDFVSEAVNKGAGGVVVSESCGRLPLAPLKDEGREPSFVQISDTLYALGNIANYHRKRFNIPIIAITGSNGKTTTKELISHILAAKFSVLKNEGTKNNLFGVPLTLLELNSKHNVGVIEMGTSCLGEIKRLSEITCPNIGVITNIGPSHLEFLGDINSVFKAKYELFESLGRDGMAVLNGDDGLLKSVIQLKDENSRRRKTTNIPDILTFGINNASDFTAQEISCGKDGISFTLNTKYKFGLKLLGRHNIYNALAAIAVCSNFGIDLNKMVDSLYLFQPPSMRMEKKFINGVEVIDDTYNSNPQSLCCAIDFLSAYRTTGKKIIVSGDMLELGKLSDNFHFRAGEMVASSNINLLIAVGKLSMATLEGAIKGGMDSRAIFNCNSAKEAAEILLSIVDVGDIVLIKGSRSMRMEEIIGFFNSETIVNIKTN